MGILKNIGRWQMETGVILINALQADLGSIHNLTSVTLNWGTWGQPVHNKEVLPKDFQIWVGNDPTFPSGSYIVAASMIGFTDTDDDGILTLPFASPVNGRWVRYVVTLATGTMYYDYALGEMQIHTAQTRHHRCQASSWQRNREILLWGIDSFPGIRR